MKSSAGPPDFQSWQRERRLAWARRLQVVGLLLCIIGLLGFWTAESGPDLGDDRRRLLGLSEDQRQFSFIVGGRDRLYFADQSEPIYDARGRIVGWDYRGERSFDGTNTDTLLYVSVVDDDVTMIAIPRDLHVPSVEGRINTVYAIHGADGLRRAVSELLDLPVDHHVIINLDVFKGVVEAVGGVEVNVPYRMRYVDVAGGLDIDLQPGPQRLDGKQAADFVRFRETMRGDYDRIDRVKTLTYALLARVRELNVGAVGRIPDLADAVMADVETNVGPAVIAELLPRLTRVRIRAATLPTYEVEGSAMLHADPRAVADFLASTFGGEGRAWAEPPPSRLHVLDRSGRDGVGEAYVERLVAAGIPADRIVLGEASFDPAPSRLLVTAEVWDDADFYADLLGLGKQQIDRLPPIAGASFDLQLVLGADALDFATHPERLDQGAVALILPVAP